MLCTTLDTIRAAIGHAVPAMGCQLQPKFFIGATHVPHKWLLIAAACCAVLPLDISHLLSLLIGALGYLFAQSMQASVDLDRASGAKAGKPGRGFAPSSSWRPPASGTRGRAAPVRLSPDVAPRKAHPAPKPEVRKLSAMPVAAPTFRAVGWDAEMDELLGRIAPTPEGERAVAQIADSVKRTISQLIPDAQVKGFANGNLTSGIAFGVAVPEVDIVINVKAEVLLGRLQGRWSQAQGAGQRPDVRKLQKSAIRACTEKLVGTGAFKFRRSAFRGQEPKVTLIAPAPFGTPGQGIPVNLLVNAQTPLCNAALLTKCSEMEPATMQLQLLVKRWARDRGLSHAAKGHLPPYAWTLLTIYFLQVGCEEEGGHLPPLAGLKVESGLVVKGAAVKPPASLPHRASAGELFKDFVSFYSRRFDWRKEAVSVRLGQRAAPDLSLPLHIIIRDDGVQTEVGPSIEDPFDPSQNLGACMTAASLKHLYEELARAEECCTSGASLTQLLEPWAPPDVAGQREDEEEES